jgi:16S rRNA (guanine527-N7)-methyltransferase
MTVENRISELLSCLSSQGITTSWVPDDAFLAGVSSYLSLLHKWNATHDLVAPGSIEDFILPHILDSLASVIVLADAGLVPASDQGSGFSFSDIGSGAGLPGVLWHLWYGGASTAYLVEPRRKRCSFLKTVAGALSLEHLHVVEGKSNALCKVADKVDVALLRALKPDEQILKDLSYYKGLRVFWLTGPGMSAPGAWSKTSEYFLHASGEHKRVIYDLSV